MEWGSRKTPPFLLSINTDMTQCNTNQVLTKPDNINFLGSNYFYFSLTRLPNFQTFVQSANLPMMSSRTINQPISLGTFPKIPAGNYYFDDLQVSFMVNADMKNWIEIYDWMKGIGNLKDNMDNLKYDPGDLNEIFSDALLMITDSTYKPILKASFKHVFPRSLGGINFNTQTVTTEPVVCSVNFAYSYYELLPAGSAG
jgi:hypothetical protein